MKFPFFKRSQKYWVGPLGILAFVVFYMTPNHFVVFEPKYLFFFDFEKSVPFLNWSIWVYLSDYLYIGLVFMLLKEKNNMNKLFYSQVLLLFFSMFIFFFFPTTFPRPVVEYQGISGALIKMLHSLDNPGNACPSIHVAMTFLAGFGFIKERRKLFPFFMLWAVLISISTITIKQHYFIDVLVGFLLSLFFYFVVYKNIKEKK